MQKIIKKLVFFLVGIKFLKWWSEHSPARLAMPVESLKKEKFMSNSIQKDQKRRNLYAKYEIKRFLLKSIIRDSSISKSFKFQSINELSKLPRNSSLGRIKNRCIETGRSKSNYRMFKISRITFRELALKGLLPGVTKASW